MYICECAVTVIFCVATFVYLVRQQKVRDHARWILIVLALITNGYLCEIALAALAIAQLHNPASKANLLWSLIFGTLGVT